MEVEKVNTLEFLKSFLFDDFNSFQKQDQDRYIKIMKQVISDVYDDTKQVIIPLNKNYTEYARRLLCSTDINKNVFHNHYSIEYSAYKKVIINNLKKILSKYITMKGNNIGGNYRNTLNSIYACSNYQEYYHMPLGLLDFNISMLSQFVSIGCYEVADVLSYTKSELRRAFEYVTAKSINHKFNNIGLKFAEELSDAEKKKIISYASDEMIMNSGINWIDSSSKKFRNYKTIGDFRKHLNIHDVDISLELLYYLKEIGINFPEIDERIRRTDNQSGNYNVLNQDVYELSLPTQVKNALYREGIRDIKTLITYSLKEISYINRISPESALEIEKIVNSYGLSLKEDPENIKHR